MKMQSRYSLILLFLLSSFYSILCGQNPGTGKMLFIGATIHTAEGITLENGFMVVENGKISRLESASGLKYADSDFDSVISIPGKHIWPGILALNTTIGLREVNAVRATLDHTETGDLNPNVRSLTAYNADSKIIPTLLSNGIVTVQTVPHARLIGGTSSLFYTRGWNWEDAMCKADDGLHIFWPASPGPGKVGDTSKAIEKAKADLQLLIDLFRQATVQGENNIKLNPLKQVLTGKSVLYIHADRARDIADAVQFSQEFGVKRMVLMGGKESWRVCGLLRKHRIPVVLPNLHRLPDNPDEPVDLPFRLPALLHDSGITVALSYSGGMEANVRNLGFTAGTAVAYGLDRETALKMISLHPAQIAGIDAREGSLRVGKNATFFISSGDLLDMRSATIEQAYILGLPQSLDNSQKQLYRKYMNKFQLN